MHISFWSYVLNSHKSFFGKGIQKDFWGLVQPKIIVLPDGRHIRYNRAVLKALKNQQKTIDKYISENLIHGY